MRSKSLTALVLLSGSLAALAQEAPPAVAAVAPADTAFPSEAIGEAAAGAEFHPVALVVRSTAPVGSRVTLEGVEAAMDSAGAWSVALVVDSLRRLEGSFDLCLELGGQQACSPLRPQGFDTLDIRPLEMTVDSVVETRDTVVTTYAGEVVDSAALAGAGVLLRESQAGRTVTVRGRRRPPRTLGQERVTIQTIKRMPGLAEPDVVRAVQALPGVVASSDFSTKLYVRGSGSDQNLILFDNAVVYNPAHFGGLFSTFLADATGGLEFYKGGFDPRWGNRLSSVLLVSSKTGGSDARDSLSWLERKLNPARGEAIPVDTAVVSDSVMAFEVAAPQPGDSVRLRGAVRVTTFSGSVAADGRSGNWSFAGATRRTWLDQALWVTNKTGLTDLNLSYFFYDNQGDLAWGNQGDSVRVSVYQGRDKLDLGFITADWGNFAVPLNVRKQMGPELAYKGTLAWSKFDQQFRFSDILSLDNEIVTWNTRHELQWDPSRAHRLTAGYELNTFEVLFAQNIIIAQSEFSERTHNLLHSGWAQERWSLGDHVLTAGVRGYWSRELGAGPVDPRLAWTWRFAPDWKADLGFGRYTQYLTSLSFDGTEMPTEFWFAARGPMEPSTQWMTTAGLERQDWGPLGLRASLEGYYKSVDDLPLFFQNSTSSENEELDESGGEYFANRFETLRGYAAGAELNLSRDEGWWTGSLSYALSFAALQQDDYANSIDTLSFDATWADWDQRHTAKVTAALNWLGRSEKEGLRTGRDAPLWTKILSTAICPPAAFYWWGGKGDFLRSNVQATWSTGQPYTEYEGYQRTHDAFQGTGATSEGGGSGSNTTLVTTTENGVRKSDYFRLDMTPVEFGRAGKWRFYWTWINVTDHDNLYSISYDTSKNPPELVKTNQFPFLPVFLGYEYEF